MPTAPYGQEMDSTGLGTLV